MTTDTEKNVYRGIAASRGAGLGKVFFPFQESRSVQPTFTEDSARELRRFDEAHDAVHKQLETLFEETLANVGSEEAMIFQIHQDMLDDLDFREAIVCHISEEKNSAEYAVFQAGGAIEEMFLALDDAYIRERAADIRDISRRLIRFLQGEADVREAMPEEPYILAADDLFPSQTIRLNTANVLAFITREGSRTSHSSILARTLGIPAIVGLGDAFDGVRAAALAGVNGSTGELCLDPTAAQIEEYRRLVEQHKTHQRLLAKQKGLPSVSEDGVKMELCANIGRPDDLFAVLDNDADGIGLFRSEFLYLEGDAYPSEEAQYDAYKYVLAKMNGKRVVIRTFDIGADKTAPYMDFPPEDNPAMGCRAVRVSLREPELFKTQLRALLRASVFGRLAIMIPMISSLSEFRAAKSLFAACKAELLREGHAVSDSIEFGMMVEVPSAAICSDQFAKEADFFSVGTNDLTQFVLAADRMNGKLGEIFDPSHPAVLRMIEMTAKAAAENGIWCGVCGESAADLTLTETYMRMGVTELSVTPNVILELREKVRSVNLTR